MKLQSLIAAALLLLILLISGLSLSGRRIPIAVTPSLTGDIEYCLTCHSDVALISISHPIDTFGCVTCHGGERLALNSDLAHSTLRAGQNPSDLEVVEYSCGGSECHSGSSEEERDHIQRVKLSIQATYAGAIAALRFTFGAQSDLTAHQGIFPIQNPEYKSGDPGVPGLQFFDLSNESNPSLLQFGENCLYCHISSTPAQESFYWETTGKLEQDLLETKSDDQNEFARFSGCSACHTIGASDRSGQTVHNLTTAIPYTQCNTCHNRGNYDLRQMVFIPRSDGPTSRLEDYYQPIAQFVRCEWTLDCIDCHTRKEAMGDGFIHSSQKEAQYIRCYTCHGTLTDFPLTATIQDQENIALRLAFLNPVIDLIIGDTIIITEKGEPLWNTRQLTDGTYELFGKANNQRFTFRPVAMTDCQQKPDEQEFALLSHLPCNSALKISSIQFR